jgi:hypothetical protein
MPTTIWAIRPSFSSRNWQIARCSAIDGSGIGNKPTFVALVVARLVVRLPAASK